MDFFEHQDKARKKTVQLVMLFCLGLFATLVAVNLVCFAAYWALTPPTTTTVNVDIPNILGSDAGLKQTIALNMRQSGLVDAYLRWWHSNLNWQVSVGVLVIVAMGTLFRYLELAGGGRKVAAWAGATPVSALKQDGNVKTYVNVSEEMAIAAGMPVPELYVMDREQGINAFVAGLSADQAVMVVTRGALTQLNRDQLQGVIGHEYSHILNGDMRLNIRLMASLAGLVLLGQVGRFFLESSLHSRRSYSRSKDDAKAKVVFIGIGAALMLIGYIGVLVGRMIKAAVSRQREYLADASSVQFTRNPDGIAGALFEIQNYVEGSQLQHQHAEDMSHFCFGESVALSSRLSTHPPLADRIKRINPTFVAKARAKRRKTETAEQSIGRSAPNAFETTMAAASLSAMVGQVSPDHVSYAQKLYKHIPEQVKMWVHQSVGARAYLYCQVLLGSDGRRQAIVNELKERDPEVLDTLQKMWPFVKKMDEQLRLPVLELCIPTLKKMSESDCLVFVDRLAELVALDGRVDFIEWVTLTLTKIRLSSDKPKYNQKLVNKIAPYKQSLHVLFSALVELSPDKVKAEAMLKQVCGRFDIDYSPKNSLEEVGYDKLAEALSQLETVSFLWRKSIIQACADIVESDGRIAFREYEALRVIGECFECPLPPLVMEITEVTANDLDAIEYRL
jgi:Zn-dependent protease with chaperone function